MSNLCQKDISNYKGQDVLFNRIHYLINELINSDDNLLNNKLITAIYAEELTNILKNISKCERLNKPELYNIQIIKTYGTMLNKSYEKKLDKNILEIFKNILEINGKFEREFNVLFHNLPDIDGRPQMVSSMEDSLHHTLNTNVIDLWNEYISRKNVSRA